MTMNIFFLFISPILAAQGMGDKHVIKMILETAQLLCTAYRYNNGQRPQIKKRKMERKEVDTESAKELIKQYSLYKMTHTFHPSAVWARESKGNFLWLLQHGEELVNEWKYRYGHPTTRKHKCESIFAFLRNTLDDIPFEKQELTIPPLCMPDEYKITTDDNSGWDNVINSYRNYYKHGKKDIAKWIKKPLRKPEFI